MVRFGLFGCGRIGRMHADTTARHPRATLSMVYDVVPAAADAVASKHGCTAAKDVDQILESGEVDAVLIASSTDTHVDLITRSAKAKKAIMCEKPIDLDIAKVDACRAEIAPYQPIVQIGFNRRFDPSFKAVKNGIASGEVGKLELLVITSRDPGPPPAAYIKVSGGLFRDMMIHDFDLARFMLDEEPMAVSAMASVLVDPEIGKLGDIDTAMVTLKAASGALVHINCSRRAVYGYDQRVEAFGEKGMLQADNRRATTVRRYGADHTDMRDPLLDFFIERYAEAYTAELDAFIDAIENGARVPVGFEDGRRALILADAALQALKSGKTIDLQWD
ncbi:MAG TPA: inositol 2-dehydrogenase [Geminicoccus sp.]|jgi:myo-inositol 2-dehydrogenase/D-chiro-inositol 1-dehydrogenase|uniref:inositol 2-dehydrogenase n=1 Tax=Geminicoccus sp. TaxID=2024832 RepID=UPI002E37819B|nr:inositol 2-dehydrogenase [Geminicoccus sp.]HEX2529748.1 inositol 2-dehydrogenase [Geminicoccus sp.]